MTCSMPSGRRLALTFMLCCAASLLACGRCPKPLPPLPAEVRVVERPAACLIRPSAALPDMSRWSFTTDPVTATIPAAEIAAIIALVQALSSSIASCAAIK